jgi:hypothetical protein
MAEKIVTIHLHAHCSLYYGYTNNSILNCSTVHFSSLVKVILEDESVSNIVVLDPLDCLSGLRHWIDLVDDRSDALLSGDLEHLIAALGQQYTQNDNEIRTLPSWNQCASNQ